MVNPGPSAHSPLDASGEYYPSFWYHVTPTFNGTFNFSGLPQAERCVSSIKIRSFSTLNSSVKSPTCNRFSFELFLNVCEPDTFTSCSHYPGSGPLDVSEAPRRPRVCLFMEQHSTVRLYKFESRLRLSTPLQVRDCVHRELHGGLAEGARPGSAAILRVHCPTRTARCGHSCTVVCVGIPKRDESNHPVVELLWKGPPLARGAAATYSAA